MNSATQHKFKWPIGVTLQFSASAEEVWDLISTPEILEKTHPFCKRNPVHTWFGEGSKDTIEYYNGRIMHREFYFWKEGLGYDLLIGREGGRKSKVTWRIKPQDTENSALTITIFPNNLQERSWIRSVLLYYSVVKPMLKKYLLSVLTGFDHYLNTGEPVSKNQFGTHKWFSTQD